MKRLCNKRIVAVSVVVLFIVTIISNSFSAGITTYKALVEKREINNFVKNTCDIIHEYDENKDFSVDDGANILNCSTSGEGKSSIMEVLHSKGSIS